MKKYLIIITSLFIINSCTDEHYESMNIDPVNPSEMPASDLFSNALVSLFDQMNSTSVNQNVFRLFAQQWTETTYTAETNYDIRNRAIPDFHWGAIYRDVLLDLKSAKDQIENDETLLDEEKNNQLAVVDLVAVYAWQQMVDTFGNIPYSQALMGADNTAPAYDDAATIYDDLLDRVNNDLSIIDLSSEGFGSNDLIYAGDMSAWRKFGASLKLKIAMRLADVNPAVAQNAVAEAINTGVFTSNSDNFVLQYEATTPNNNPLYDDLELSGRNDFVPANTFVDYLNGLEDPRRTIFFDDNLTDGDGNVYYEGGIYGALNSFPMYTHIGEAFYQPDLPGVLLDYSEVEFLLADAVERGYAVSGSAEDHYNSAITANMEYWGVESSEIATYLAQPDVAYSTAPGTWKEKIGKQFWIAMYNRGFEGWTVWRMYNAPQLNLPAATGSSVPLRFTYPVEEQTLNVINYNAAVGAMGGDTQQTRIFWDVN